LRPSSNEAATQPVTADVPAVHDDDVDLTELVDAHDAPPSDSVARLMTDLGAEVVEERPRD
jgi:hypothetical protein